MLKTLNILQIIPRLNAGGAEVGCLAVAKALVDQGHRAVIATSGGRMVDQAIQHGVEILSIPVASKSPWQIWRNAQTLKAFIGDNAIDIIHARSRAPAWSAYWAAQATDTPLLTTYHGAYGQQNGLKHYYNSVMVKANTVIAPSQFMADHIVQHYPKSRQKIQVIPRGIDLDQFTSPSSQDLAQLKQTWGIQDGKRIVLLPARFTRLKGHDVCMAAAQLIRDFLLENNVNILFVGQSDKPHYLNELKQTIETHQLQDVIHFHDHCSQLQLAYGLSEIVLVCSTEPESFGRTTVEAQAMGRLVIASDHGGCKETVKHDVTGWLVPPSDAEALAQAIKQALLLPADKREAMGKAASTWAREQFDQTQMITKTIDAYRALIHARD